MVAGQCGRSPVPPVEIGKGVPDRGRFPEQGHGLGEPAHPGQATSLGDQGAPQEVAGGIVPAAGDPFAHGLPQDDGGFAQAAPHGNLLDGGLAQNLTAAQHAIGFEREGKFLGRRKQLCLVNERMEFNLVGDQR